MPCSNVLYIGYPVILGQVSLLLQVACLSSEHISSIVATFALFCYCVFWIKMMVMMMMYRIDRGLFYFFFTIYFMFGIALVYS